MKIRISAALVLLSICATSAIASRLVRVVGWEEQVVGEDLAGPFMKVAAGGCRSLALRADGSIAGWGENAYGGLITPAGTGFTAITGRSCHGLALKADGSIVGWGNNEYGQATPPSGTGFTAIASGDRHSLALRADGTIVGWGDNQWNGQATPPPGSGFTAIAAGAFHSLGLRADGSIVAWGYNSRGQATPPSGTGFTAIAAGTSHSLALRTDGSIVGWGDNTFGQTTPPSGTGFIAIVAGGYHSLALRANGSIVAWGSNDDVTTGDYCGQATAPSGTGFVAIGAGEYHSIGLRADGSIAGWGLNSSGQVAPPCGTDFMAIDAGCRFSLALRANGSIVGWGQNNYGQATPPGGTGFTAVAAGGWHSLALRSDGGIVGWGNNAYGQATPPAGTDFVAVAAGGTHSLALRVDGTIVGWGQSNYGQATAPLGTGFTAIAAGYLHSLALRADGSIAAWGNNSKGQCNVPSGTGYIAIAAGEMHSLALRADGSIVGWGLNEYGQATPPSGTGYTAIVGAYNHSLALRADGSMISWGTYATSLPGTDFGAIAAGWYNSLALVVKYVPPSPDPMTWSILPHAISPTSISMGATRATDNTGAEYYFACTEGGGHDSGWQDSTVYTDTGLVGGTTYSYTVKARDKSDRQNETAPSVESLTTIPAFPPTKAVSPVPADGSTSQSVSVVVRWSNGGEATYYDVYLGTSSSLGPADRKKIRTASTSYTALSPLEYGRAYYWRIDSINVCGTTTGDVWGFTTQEAPDLTSPTPNPMTWQNKPFATSPTSLSMSATTASDISGVEYFFRCTVGGGHDSGWQTGTSYMDTGLAPSNTYTYTVMARDLSPSQNQTVASAPASATTLLPPQPASPTGLVASDGAYSDRIRLTWNGVAGVDGYEIWWNTANDNATAFYYTDVMGAGNTTFDDIFDDLNTTFWYWVKAFNVAGCSDWSMSDSGFTSMFRADFLPVTKRRIGRTEFEYDCKVVLTNNSDESVRVTQFEVQSVPANMSIVDASVSIFEDIDPDGSATSEDTCTFRVDRSVPINESQVTWRVNYEVIESGQMMQAASFSQLNLEPKVVGDMSGDGSIDSADLVLLAEQWLGEPGEPSADIAPEPLDGVVNFLDYAVLAGRWLEGASQ